jgi:hypothetical protein
MLTFVLIDFDVNEDEDDEEDTAPLSWFVIMVGSLASFKADTAAAAAAAAVAASVAVASA